MKKILIIEDELAVAELEKDYLALSDFEVSIVTDGLEGEQRAMSGEFDLLILDIKLPGRDGFEICRRFRQKYQNPVLIVSEKKEDIDIIHGLGLGADDYIVKPFSPAELVARVKAHMNRYDSLVNVVVKKTPENEILEINGLQIDKTARRIFVDGIEKKLTMKEFDLLYYLAKNPNRVYSKPELFRRVWGEDPADGDVSTATATVTVHVKKIRGKIEKDSSNPKYIETIWGSGYRFKTD